MVLLREALPIWQTNKLSVLVIPNGFQLLPLGRYLLPVTTLNRYQPRNSNEKIFFTTTSRNVSIVRYRVSLITILLLHLVSVYWIQWIQWKSFRENSNIKKNSWQGVIYDEWNWFTAISSANLRDLECVTAVVSSFSFLHTLWNITRSYDNRYVTCNSYIFFVRVVSYCMTVPASSIISRNPAWQFDLHNHTAHTFVRGP